MAERVDIGELLDNIDVESYLDREGVSYKIAHGSSGTQINLRECPVCGHNGWKVYLNADTGLGNCFAGDHPPGENFNKWSLIQSLSGFDNRETISHIKTVAREMGWRARKTTSMEVSYDKTELVLPESVELPLNGRNLKYLSDRNIDIGTTGYFHLRYSKKGVFWYRDYNGEIKYQDYKKRIIIPIFGMDGELVSFQGRDVTDTSSRKYLFPPGFSSTGKFLYNGHNALGSKRVVACEGVFDVMATKIALDEEMALRDVAVVGTFGKHLSKGSTEGEDQLNKFIQLKAAGCQELTIMWDGERQALLDASNAAVTLKGLGIEVKIAVLPKDRDPNEVAPSVVRQAYWEAMSATRGNLVKLKMLAAKR